VRAEYDYTDLGRGNFNLGGTTTKAGAKTSDIKLGVNYKF